MLMNPVFADYMQAYGEGGLRAKQLGVLDKLARVYWYTVEFGLMRAPDGLRIYGAGIASSATETIFALEDTSPNRLGFDLERVMRTPYRIDDFQETYFVIDSLDELLELAHIDFAPSYERIAGASGYGPGEVLWPPSGDLAGHGNIPRSQASGSGGMNLQNRTVMIAGAAGHLGRAAADASARPVRVWCCSANHRSFGAYCLRRPARAAARNRRPRSVASGLIANVLSQEHVNGDSVN